MIYNDFQNKKLSMLGFGTMRLPMKEDQTIDEAQVSEMTAYAISHGVNYFDTAYPYHSGEAERVIGRVLSSYPRDSYYLATKYPGHQISSSYNPAAVFEEQLEKCGTEYFDFYLLHNVYENSIQTYLDPRWGILEYFKEQKRHGRIRHLGFSCHAQVEGLKEFLDACGEDMEFCQIQLNYLDWTLQNAKEKYELLTQRGIPVWVMEPVRGGRLARLDEQNEKRLRKIRPEESTAAWGFRFLQGLPNVKMVLSGMSNMEQMQDNVRTFSEREVLSDEETQLLLDIAEGMKNSIPCTACRYCCDGCPMGLNIPELLSAYNELRFSPAVNVGMRIEALPADKRPSACISCGQCAKICPQSIDIPGAMREFSEELSKLPSWAEICRQRDEAARKTASQETDTEEERFRKQLDFILEIDKEKNIYRQTHLTGHGRRENDAEHAWHMAIMIYLLKEYANEEFDVGKAMMMALIHDVVEIDAGDTYAYDETGLATQQEREEKAAQRIFGLLPEKQQQELRQLFDEFESFATPEARFVRAMDNFQPLLLNNSNEGGDWKEHKISRSQVMKRQERTMPGSEKIWQYSKKLIEENVKKGSLLDE